jgi:signal transduction histidine kinase
MFHTTRLKLTLWYVLISTVVSILFSIAIFGILQRQLAYNENRFMSRIDWLRDIDPNFDEHFEAHQEDVQATQRQLILNLLYIDIFIVGLSALAGYFLAGRSLRPIQEMVDKQNQFIADASHEFRTPLTALKTAIEVNLRNKDLSPEDAKKVFKENLNDVDRMRNLSDNLLSLAKLQTQGTEQFENIALDEVIKQSISNTALLAKEKKIAVTSSLPKSHVVGSKARLTELFTILLDNAVKYSAPKTKIYVKLKHNPDSNEVIIKDNGIGISPEDLPHIFERFYRADKSRSTMHTEGYGLGLAIAKEIVQSHGGTIEVKSSIKKGSIFSVKLPNKKQ